MKWFVWMQLVFHIAQTCFWFWLWYYATHVGLIKNIEYVSHLSQAALVLGGLTGITAAVTAVMEFKMKKD
jgi:hypothetical protein